AAWWSAPNETIRPATGRLRVAVTRRVIRDDLRLREAHRRSFGPARRARRQQGRHRRDTRRPRPRPSASRAVRPVREGAAQSRLRPVLLLPDAGARALPRAATELAAAGR